MGLAKGPWGAPAAYYTTPTRIPGNPVNCDEKMRTTSYPACSGYDAKFPWKAPGTAPVRSPCGNGKSDGKDGLNLPKTKREVWQAGTEVKAAWAIQNNHGGGYAYRLCPASSPTTEACFQQHHLEFVGDTSVVHWHNGTETTIPAVTTTAGTSPAGSKW